MKGPFAIVFLLFLPFTFLPINAESTSYQHEDYDRIYKENDIWYGVIDLKDSHLTGWNCVYNKCHQNAIYVSFTRDTEKLTSITYDYKTQAPCRGVNLFGLCIGSKGEQETGSETVYNHSDHGPFLTYLLNSNPITEINAIFGDAKYDYRIVSETSTLFESIDIIEFTYILTDEEVDNIMTDIQDQYDRELHSILIDQSLSFDQKERKEQSLKEEYSYYTIEYGEDLRSRCENETLCHIESSSNPIELPTLFDFRSIIKKAALVIFITLLAFTALKEITYNILNIILTLTSDILQGLYNATAEFIIMPTLNATKLLTTKIFNLIFWWL